MRQVNSVELLIPEIREYFRQIADKLGCRLSFTYEFLGHQIYNEHDCLYFSSIYSLYRTMGRLPKSLTPYDLYIGFRYLESQNTNRSTSKFAAFMMRCVKRPLRRMLDWYFGPPDFSCFVRAV